MKAEKSWRRGNVAADARLIFAFVRPNVFETGLVDDDFWKMLLLVYSVETSWGETSVCFNDIGSFVSLGH